MINNKTVAKEKLSLHSRNKHRQRYDFKQLVAACSELKPFIRENEYGDNSIDFFNPKAVLALNKALLKYYYQIDWWEIPENYLCSPIPGRADYIHNVADLLGGYRSKLQVVKIPTGVHIKCLDIGVGANCVYPIIGSQEYGWSFVGSDVDAVALNAAQKIVDLNTVLKGKIELRLQSNTTSFFEGIIQKGEQIDVTICNPPFHASLAEAKEGSNRKFKNLNQQRTAVPVLNFGGQKSELWCEGGEEKFVRDMIYESEKYATSCFWFTSLISREAHLKGVYEELKKVNALDVKTIPMGQGNKISRIVAWSFLNPEQQQKWVDEKWKIKEE